MDFEFKDLRSPIERLREKLKRGPPREKVVVIRKINLIKRIKSYTYFSLPDAKKLSEDIIEAKDYVAQMEAIVSRLLAVEYIGSKWQLAGKILEEHRESERSRGPLKP